MKTTDIINYAKRTGKRIEISYPSSNITYISGEVFFYGEDYYYRIGIELEPMMWYWWKVLVLPIDDEMTFGDCVDIDNQCLHFSNMYSQKTGYTTEGWKTGWRAEQKIID